MGTKDRRNKDKSEGISNDCKVPSRRTHGTSGRAIKSTKGEMINENVRNDQSIDRNKTRSLLLLLLRRRLGMKTLR